MTEDIVISVRNVSMAYNLITEGVDSLKEYMLRLLRGRLGHEKFYALNDVSLEVKRGESVALIGVNGSGKSTLLKVIAGVIHPTTGSLTVKGNIAPMIELGAGFDPELTARENIFLNGAVLGYNRKFMRAHFDNIIDFAELRDFMDIPVKNFSSGMVARLGFAIATELPASVLIVDEVLAVGDAHFQEKCRNRMEQMLSGGTTLLFVSHDISLVKQLCNRVVWLDKGKTVMSGDVDTVCAAYETNRSNKLR